MTEQGRILRMQARSSGNNGPAFVQGQQQQFKTVKRTPRFLKLHVKKSQNTNWMDMRWKKNSPLAPPI